MNDLRHHIVHNALPVYYCSCRWLLRCSEGLHRSDYLFQCTFVVAIKIYSLDIPQKRWKVTKRRTSNKDWYD